MPDYQGDNLNVAVEDVWETAAVHFPAMAAAYHAANDAVYHTSEVIRYDADCQFMFRWNGIRDELISILGYASMNIEDTATALREAMTAYAREDGAAADALSRAMKDLPDFVPELPPTKDPIGVVNRTPHRSQRWEPVSREQLDGMYTGDAPTMADLQALAQEVDDKLYEADVASRTGLEGLLAEIAPRSWVEGAAEGQYLFIVDLIRDSVRGNPAWFEQGIVALRDIADPVSASKPFGMFRTEVNNAKSALDPEKWGGEAAREFRSNFLDAYEDIAEAQAAVVSLLHSALSGYKRALETTYRGYRDAMDATIRACQSIIDGAAAAESSFEIAGLQAVLTIGGIVATGGTSALSQTAGMFSLADAGLSIAGSQSAVGGGDVGTVHENLVGSVNAIRGKLADFDQQLADGLGRDLSVIQDLRLQDRVIDLPRPNFADDPSLF
jgi:hypothetical protein